MSQLYSILFDLINALLLYDVMCRIMLLAETLAAEGHLKWVGKKWV